MATNTYVALKTYTVPSPTSTVTFDLMGITGYTDLVIEMNVGISSTGQGVAMSFNSTSTGYSNTFMTGNGSSATSGRNTNQTNLHLVDVTGNSDTAIKTFITAQIQNYSNSTTYKTTLYRSQNDAITQAGVGLWANANAITNIVIGTTGGNFVNGSTFNIYGIANADIGALATGGIITYDSTYYYHTFGANGTFTPKQSLTCDYLVVAGGGGGGSGFGGGGGAGGLQAMSSQTLTATGYSVTVGAGGASGRNNGGNSSFNSLTSTGGGGGGETFASGLPGATGGSGGGGATFGGVSAGSGTSGQGNNGGAGYYGGGSTLQGGGGGGAGTIGTAAGANAGTGGDGVNTYSSWSTVTGTGLNGYYAGGGGGGGGTGNAGAGGLGGGGVGSIGGNGTNGTAYTGGGGGGAQGTGGQGGSGVVIIRYPKA